MDLQAIIENLIKQVDALKARVAYLEEENALLREENALLRQENSQLRSENESLKERLGLNSSNSSLPPSRDLYRAKKNTRPPSGTSLEANLATNSRAISRKFLMK